MKVIIAGSRSITDVNIVRRAVKLSGFEITEVVSGTARGVDRLGEQIAHELNIPVKRFPANWEKYGRRAGFLRNQEMAHYADALIAVWDGVSRGTKHMIEYARSCGLQVYVHRVN